MNWLIEAWVTLMQPWYRRRCRKGRHHGRDGIVGGVFHPDQRTMECDICGRVLSWDELPPETQRNQERLDAILSEWML